MLLFPKGLKAISQHFLYDIVACMFSLTQEGLGSIFSWRWQVSSRIWRHNSSFCNFIEWEEVLRTQRFRLFFLEELGEQARPTLSLSFFTEEQAVIRTARLSNHCLFYITLAIFANLIKGLWADGEAHSFLNLLHRGKHARCSIVLLL